MTRQELLDALHTVPFIPFRIFASGGVSFDIRHPELCVPGLLSVFIGMPNPKNPEPAFERFTLIDLQHVIRIEPIEAAAPPAGAKG